ncbi:MAG: pilus assembly protein [Acidobacteriales bacterium]|nr:pilus assembly protein [Terriglobales bacterium]
MTRGSTKQPGGRRRRGSAVVEVTLLAPWVFFLFIGVLDFGFYAYSIISTQNAARVAALYTSANSYAAVNQARACEYAKDEMRTLPNVDPASDCLSGNLVVATTMLPEPFVNPGVPQQYFARVSVTYQTIPMIPIPGLAGQMTITRIAEMRVKR